MKHQSLILHNMKLIYSSSYSYSSRLNSGCCWLLRGFSSSIANREAVDKNALFKMLSAVKPNDKVSGLLHRLTKDGKLLYKSDLFACVRMLRKSRRYHHCLQILDWIEKGTKNSSESDHALRLGIIYSLQGIKEAEKFFDGLPSDMKRHSTYGALLNCYCTENMTDKALALFEKMDEMDYSSNVLAFNNVMGLYMKVDQPEKVPPLVQEMKRRNIPLRNHSYSIWIQSYGSLNDLEGIERVMNEVQEQGDLKNEWTIYSNLASVYIKLENLEKAEAALKKQEEILDTQSYPNNEAYHYLISLCARTNNLESLTRVWDKLKSKSKFCSNHSYMIMLNALSKLNDVEGLEKCFKEWESSNQSFDSRLPTVVILAYLKWDMAEEAELLLKDSNARCGQKLWNACISLAEYYLSKKNIGSAMKHMESVIDHEGKLFAEGVKSFFKYFQEEKDVDGAEEFCQILKKANRFDDRAKLWLSQTYEAAGKQAPELELPQNMTSGIEEQAY